VKCGVRGRNINACVLKRRQNQEPQGGEARDPWERKGSDGCVILLGRSHQGRPEVGDTLMMIFHGVEISIAGGGADEKDEHEIARHLLSTAEPPSHNFSASSSPIPSAREKPQNGQGGG